MNVLNEVRESSSKTYLQSKATSSEAFVVGCERSENHQHFDNAFHDSLRSATCVDSVLTPWEKHWHSTVKLVFNDFEA